MNNSLNFPLPLRIISIKIIWIICQLNTAACFIFHVIYPWAVSLFVCFPFTGTPSLLLTGMPGRFVCLAALKMQEQRFTQSTDQLTVRYSPLGQLAKMRGKHKMCV